jgi:hypothetical protein
MGILKCGNLSHLRQSPRDRGIGRSLVLHSLKKEQMNGKGPLQKKQQVEVRQKLVSKSEKDRMFLKAHKMERKLYQKINKGQNTLSKVKMDISL